MELEVSGRIYEYVAGTLEEEPTYSDVVDNWFEIDNLAHFNSVEYDLNYMSIEADGNEVDVKQIKIFNTNKEIKESDFLNENNKQVVLDIKNSEIAKYYKGWRETYGQGELFQAYAENKGSIIYDIDLEKFVPERMFFLLVDILLFDDPKLFLVINIGYVTENNEIIWFDLESIESVNKGISFFYNLFEIE